MAASLQDVQKVNAEGKPYFSTPKEMAAHLEAGLVTAHPETKQGNKIAFGITDKGKAQLGAAPTNGQTEVPGQSPKPTFEIRDDLEMPKGTRTRGPGMKYPFERLNVNQSFVVPLDPAKDVKKQLQRIQGAVAVAQRRYETGEKYEAKNRKGQTVTKQKPTRIFRARLLPDNAGIGVWRTA